MATHRMTGTPEWIAWKQIRSRCRNPNHQFYHRYGGRGITICERWAKFENFYADMGPRPDGMTLERTNNDGNYEPQNCRWATHKDQCRNRRSNRLLTFLGETKCLQEWAEQYGLHKCVLQGRVAAGWSVGDALTTPLLVQGYDRHKKVVPKVNACP